MQRVGRRKVWWRFSLFEERGQALVELALVTPFLLFLLLGASEIAYAFNAYISVVNAAREGARLVARGNVFSNESVRLVVVLHSQSIDLSSQGTVVVHRVEFDAGGNVTSYTCVTLQGSDLPRLSQDTLRSMHSASTSSSLLKESVSVVEVIYRHHSLTGLTQLLPFLAPDGTVMLYSYSIMPVSAPS